MKWNVSYHVDWQQQEDEQEQAAAQNLKQQLRANAESHADNQAMITKMILDDNAQKQKYVSSVNIEIATLKSQLTGAVARENTMGGELYQERCEVRQLRAERSAGVSNPGFSAALNEGALQVRLGQMRVPVTGAGCTLDKLAARPICDAAIRGIGITTTETPLQQPWRTPQPSQPSINTIIPFHSAMSATPAGPTTYKVDANDSSTTESANEAFIRRRTLAKSFTLHPAPEACNLRPWLSKLQSDCMSASNRNKRRTQRFIRKIIEAATLEELEKVSKRWDSFDTEPSAAVFNCTSGSLTHELILYRETCERELRPASGMAHLHLMLKRYDIERGQALQVDTQVLLAQKYQGSLENYLNGLDAKLVQFIKEPDPDLLMALVEPELRKAEGQLAREFATFGRAAPGSHERPLKFLIKSARGATARERKLQMFANLQPRPTMSPSMPATGLKGNQEKDEGKVIPIIMMRGMNLERRRGSRKRRRNVKWRGAKQKISFDLVSSGCMMQIAATETRAFMPTSTVGLTLLQLHSQWLTLQTSLNLIKSSSSVF